MVFFRKDAKGRANSEDPEEQSDLGLHYLPRPICPKTLVHFGNTSINNLKNLNSKSLLFYLHLA